MAGMRNVRQFKCYICGRNFSSVQDLVKHDLKLDYRQERLQKLKAKRTENR
jgi:hypothetical protein